MTQAHSPLNDIRKEIDKIDYQVHDLLNLRAELALKVAKIKIQEGKHLVSFYRPEREAQIIKQITEYNKGPLSAKAVAHIFRTVIKECCDLQINTYPELSND